MVVEVKKSECSRMEEISRYNNNYYELPIMVNGCNVLFEHCQEEYNTYDRSVGQIVGGLYTPVFYLHTDERGDSDSFIFDCDELKDHNEWT